VHETFGGFDILVNNVGFSYREPLEEMHPEDFVKDLCLLGFYFHL
jgi:NAD(P)-dependent dehydrogenase (short-subunit alcohol dehydrogenase family)